jgi:hypothetical protein
VPLEVNGGAAVEIGESSGLVAAQCQQFLTEMRIVELAPIGV